MATWTAPPTWAATDTPSATDMNNYISENLRFLHTKDKVHVYRSTNESVGNAAWELLNWTAESYDSGSMHDNVTNNGRLSCTTDGAYLLTFKINYDTNTTGIRRVMARLNSGGSDSGGTALGTWYEDGVASNQTTVHGARLVVMATGSPNDYIELFGYQDSGGALNIISGANTSFVQLIQITG